MAKVKVVQKYEPPRITKIDFNRACPSCRIAKKYILVHNRKVIALGGRKDLPTLVEIARMGGDGWAVQRFVDVV